MAPFANYHRPHQTTETGSHPSSRVTARTFDYAFGPRILDRVKAETVTVGGESYTTSTEYDNGTGFLIERTVNGITTSFDPGARGNVWRETGAIVTTFWYSWGALENTNTPLHTIARSINPDGTLASETRGGHTTSYTYDAIGRPQVMDPPEGDNAVTNYDDANRTVTVCRGTECTATVHDSLGRPVSVANPAGVTTITKYNLDGRKNFDGYPNGGETGGDTFTHDALNRVTAICHPGNSCRSMLYGANTVTITDEEGHQTLQRFEAFGDPFGRRLSSLRDANLEEWAYGYTALGALTRVDGPGAIPDRTWTYNAQHQLASEGQPESGVTQVPTTTLPAGSRGRPMRARSRSATGTTATAG